MSAAESAASPAYSRPTSVLPVAVSAARRHPRRRLRGPSLLISPAEGSARYLGGVEGGARRPSCVRRRRCLVFGGVGGIRVCPHRRRCRVCVALLSRGPATGQRRGHTSTGRRYRRCLWSNSSSPVMQGECWHLRGLWGKSVQVRAAAGDPTSARGHTSALVRGASLVLHLDLIATLTLLCMYSTYIVKRTSSHSLSTDLSRFECDTYVCLSDWASFHLRGWVRGRCPKCFFKVSASVLGGKRSCRGS